MLCFGSGPAKVRSAQRPIGLGPRVGAKSARGVAATVVVIAALLATSSATFEATYASLRHIPSLRRSQQTALRAAAPAPASAENLALRGGAGPRVYNFGKLVTDGDSSMRDLLGGKGSNLAEMSKIGLSVPPGFTITTQTCQDYNQGGKVHAPRLPDPPCLLPLRPRQVHLKRQGTAPSPLHCALPPTRGGVQTPPPPPHTHTHTHNTHDTVQ